MNIHKGKVLYYLMIRMDISTVDVLLKIVHFQVKWLILIGGETFDDN